MKQFLGLFFVMFGFIQLDAVRDRGKHLRRGRKVFCAADAKKRTSPITVDRNYERARMKHIPRQGTFKGAARKAFNGGRRRGLTLHIECREYVQSTDSFGFNEAGQQKSGASPVGFVDFGDYLKKRTAFQRDFNRWTRQVHKEDGHDPLTLFQQGHELDKRSREFSELKIEHRIRTGIDTAWEFVKEDEKYKDVAPVLVDLLKKVEGSEMVGSR